MVSEQEALELIERLGSSTSTKSTTSKTTLVDSKNPLSQWIFSSASIYKIDETQVSNAIDVNITELKPNIPPQPRDFISRESYNSLLSQSIDLNATIAELREEVLTQTDRIIELENTTENEINERTAIEQTNDVLLNQLEALSETIDSFSEQISSALQKSVEESIFRTSLEAQNEGYKAQISALISQIDSLNAIIKGLYAQLGAVLIEKEVQEAAAEAAAAIDNAWNSQAVVFSLLKTTKSDGTPAPKVDGSHTPPHPYYFYAWYWDEKNYTDTGTWNQKSGWPYWEIGGGLKFENFNKVPCEISFSYVYPAYVGIGFNQSGTSLYTRNGNQTFFEFTENNFVINPGQVKTVNANLLVKDVKDDGNRYTGTAFYGTAWNPNANIKDIYDNKTSQPSYVEVSVKNLATGTITKTRINAGMKVT